MKWTKMLHKIVNCMMVCVPAVLWGQNPECNCNQDNSHDMRLTEKLTCIVLPAAEVKIPDDEVFARWCYGKIILNNGEILSGEFMHYDGLTDQLILDSKNPLIKLAADKYTIQGFDMESLNSDQIYRFRRLSVDEKNSSQDLFLQVLISGKNSLYVQRKLVRTLEVNKITRRYNYFIKKENGSMVSFVKPSRHILLRLFPEKAEQYRYILRKQHMHIRNESQLINSIALFNTL